MSTTIGLSRNETLYYYVSAFSLNWKFKTLTVSVEIYPNGTGPSEGAQPIGTRNHSWSGDAFPLTFPEVSMTAIYAALQALPEYAGATAVS